MSSCQNMPQTCQRFMPLFVQGKQLNLQGKKKNEGTLKETKFPRDERMFVPYGSSRSRARRGWSGETQDCTPCPSTGMVPWAAPRGRSSPLVRPKLGRSSPSCGVFSVRNLNQAACVSLVHSSLSARYPCKFADAWPITCER